MACQGELSSLAPIISGCPADNEILLFCNVAGQAGGYAFRTWATVKGCLFNQLFGTGIILFNGGQLNGSQQFAASAMNGLNELCFLNGIGFLTYDPNNPTYPNSQWKPIAGGGVQILIPGPFSSSDLFAIFPNGEI